MPQVTGKTLDVAKSDIKQAGFSKDIEILGGGIFGVLKDSNWEVCEQTPTTGTVVTETPRLKIARSCDDDSTPKPTETTEATDAAPSAEKTVEPTKGGVIDAKAIEAKYIEHLHNNSIESFSAMCDDAYTHWACFYDGVESGGTYLRVNLTTDGGWSDQDLRNMALKAGHDWFNFIGCDFPDLNMIVVSVNGLDNNVSRSSTNADSLCG